MKLVNLASDGSKPQFVNPDQVDAVVGNYRETYVYAGQYFCKVNKCYTKVIELLGAEVEEDKQE